MECDIFKCRILIMQCQNDKQHYSAINLTATRYKLDSEYNLLSTLSQTDGPEHMLVRP